MTRISRRDYTTKERRTYSFEASWQGDEQGVTWEASVWRNGQFVCNHQGAIQGSADANTNNVVAARVRACLEASDASTRASSRGALKKPF